MRDESVARRYAAALFNQAKDDAVVIETGAELERIVQTIEAQGQLKALLRQPLVTEKNKKKALHETFGGHISARTQSLLDLMVDKGRIDLLPAAQEEFARLVLEYRNIARATVTSAVPLTPDQIAALEKSLEQRTGKDIELETALDPDLIGGVFVRIGDTVLDGSVRGSLERLREQLLARK